MLLQSDPTPQHVLDEEHENAVEVGSEFLISRIQPGTVMLKCENPRRRKMQHSHTDVEGNAETRFRREIVKRYRSSAPSDK
jgi:hypothetical protein